MVALIKKAIADKFATVFHSACQPNSWTRHEELNKEFEQKFKSYVTNENFVNNISTSLIRCSLEKIQRGKAAGPDGLMAEHLVC